MATHAMVTGAATCGIVVPVRDEATTLATTVPSLLAAAGEERARIVWVCNGCTDTSADRIRDLAGSEAEIVERAEPGKSAALQAGDDRLGNLFPRFYVDADVRLGTGDLTRLAAPLRTGAADLVSPRRAFDCTRSSAAAAAMARCWLALPYAKEDGFLWVLGVSAAGRARWDSWPDIDGDDIFVSALTPDDRRCLVGSATATSWAPGSFAAWIRIRRRWTRGERQLRRIGLAPLRGRGQRTALLRQLASRRTAPRAALFLLARMLADLPVGHTSRTGWRPERF